MIAIVTCLLAIVCGLASPGIAGELCLLPSASNGFNVSVSCPDLMIYENDWIGFRSGGGEPCHDFGPIGMCYDREFGWTISSSPTDPFQNQADAPAGIGQLYLWLACTRYVEGVASAEFDVGGTIAVYSFTPASGFINIGDATHLLLGIDGCPTGPVVAGTFQVHDPIAVDATTWGRIKSTYR